MNKTKRPLILIFKKKLDKLFRKKSLTSSCLKLQTQINKELPLYEDRITEVCEFYNKLPTQIKSYYKDTEELNNLLIETLDKHFKDVKTNQEIIKASLNSSFLYVTNLMLGYTRLDNAFQLLQYFDCIFSQKKKRTLNILDYGCAVADYGLAFVL